jgi:hypothetical protein
MQPTRLVGALVSDEGTPCRFIRDATTLDARKQDQDGEQRVEAVAGDQP